MKANVAPVSRPDDTPLLRAIHERMAAQGISAAELERRAPGAANVLKRKSKSPREKLVKAIAVALGCTVSELIGEEGGALAKSSSEGRQGILDEKLDDLISQMTDGTKIKAIEILEILLRPDGE